jgi:enamine deaminase RidA (YjgF/YER057c/UK114 family)
MSHTSIPTPGVFQSNAPFSQATLTEGTRYLNVSGQVSQDAGGKNVSITDAGGQAMQALQNMKALVEAGGGTMADICRIVVYVLDRADLPKVMEARRYYFTAPYPATTALVVAGLANPEWRVEIEATASLK